MRGSLRDKGAAAVEFALVLPILVMLLLGVIEFGYAMFVQSTVAGAAREGARTLAITTNSASAVQAAVTAAQPAVNISGEVSANAAACSSTPVGSVTVSVKHTYTGLGGGIAWFFPHGISIRGKGVMRCGG